MEPGTKIAVISKSAEGVTHVAPSEKTSEKADSKPPPPAEKSKEDKQKPKVESTPVIEKPKTTSGPPPPKRSATEPQLPPKERERRVSHSSIFIPQRLFPWNFFSSFFLLSFKRFQESSSWCVNIPIRPPHDYRFP